MEQLKLLKNIEIEKEIVFENNIDKELKEFDLLLNNYNVIMIVYKKEKEKEIYDKLNIENKNKNEIYYYE